MKTVCRTTGLARSHVRDLLERGEDWTDGRSHRTPSDDAGLLAELRQEIAELPSDGYRHACALVDRQRTALGASRVNAKRVYRVMAGAGLLLAQGAAPAPVRTHACGPGGGLAQRPALVLRWFGNQVRLGPDSDGHLHQGLLRPRGDGLAGLGGQRAAGRAGARDAHRSRRALLRLGRSSPGGPCVGVPERQRRGLHRCRHAGTGTLAGSEAHQHARLQPAEQWLAESNARPPSSATTWLAWTCVTLGQCWRSCQRPSSTSTRCIRTRR
ncbi:Helix-turn-helix protein [Paracidovorax anthurii]|uniref:Uncharacterized protein n=1 Tax=Paracidovorax anthurii TaxID=78229 RepID=A0A328ZSH8_9BURK|nr:hypothetical protein AX018_10064 [Paracidovorax anthurii]